MRRLVILASCCTQGHSISVRVIVNTGFGIVSRKQGELMNFVCASVTSASILILVLTFSVKKTLK
jgi:hypothetical protein